MKNLPRPWCVNPYNSSQVVIVKTGPDKNGHKYIDGFNMDVVANTVLNEESFETRLVAARIISAAPEMYAELLSITRYGYDPLRDNERVSKILAKAEGTIHE